MIRIFAAGLGIVMLTAAALAQGASTPDMQVPAIREPHHFVKLDNKYARVLDVSVEPFSGTLYHIHENPYFWISIGAATLRGQTLGATEIINIEPVDAEVRYSPALTHRVGNIASTAFRNITVQIQARDDVSPGGSSSTSTRAKPPRRSTRRHMASTIPFPSVSSRRSCPVAQESEVLSRRA